MRLHKVRESNEQMFLIGKTWVLDELLLIEFFIAGTSELGFKLTIGIHAPYYWEVNTVKEKTIFPG